MLVYHCALLLNLPHPSCHPHLTTHFVFLIFAAVGRGLISAGLNRILLWRHYRAEKSENFDDFSIANPPALLNPPPLESSYWVYLRSCWVLGSVTSNAGVMGIAGSAKENQLSGGEGACSERPSPILSEAHSSARTD